MQRLALTVLVVAIAAAVIALLTRSVARSFEQRGGVSAMTAGGMMQKVSFFLLLCLIIYVSISGAS